MKTIKTLLIAATALCVTALIEPSTWAASFWGPASPTYGSSPASQVTTNGTLLATNQQFTAAIGLLGFYNGLTNACETNVVPLSTVGGTGNYVVLSLQGQAMSAATGFQATNVQFVLTSLPKGVPLTVTNSVVAGQGAGAIQPRSAYGTFTLPLNGTALVQTNILLSPNSTPAYNDKIQLFLEQVQLNGSNNILTNWSASLGQ